MHVDDIVVLTTGRLDEADLAAALLEESGVPFHRRTVNAAGIELAMPASPAPGPGLWFTIVVPRDYADRAAQILRGAALEREDRGVWDFGPSPRSKLIFRIFALLALLAIGAAVLNAIWELFR